MKKPDYYVVYHHGCLANDGFTFMTLHGKHHDGHALLIISTRIMPKRRRQYSIEDYTGEEIYSYFCSCGAQYHETAIFPHEGHGDKTLYDMWYAQARRDDCIFQTKQKLFDPSIPFVPEDW